MIRVYCKVRVFKNDPDRFQVTKFDEASDDIKKDCHENLTIFSTYYADLYVTGTDYYEVAHKVQSRQIEAFKEQGWNIDK